MRSSLFSLQLVFLATLPLLAGCRTQPLAIAVIPRTTATLLWEPLHQGIVETARPEGVEVEWNAPPEEADVEQQMRMYVGLQSKGYGGFILTPDETLAARTAVLETTKRGVPVVIVDDELGPPASDKLSYVSNDEAAGTMLAAREVVRLLHGRGTVAVTGIIPRSEAALSREEGFERAMASVAPGIRIVVRRFGDTVITHQQQIAQDIMASPVGVDAIVALSATSTRGAYYAKLANAQDRPVAIVGFDQDLLLPLATGAVDAIIAQDTRTIGQIAMRNLRSQMRGERVSGMTLVPPLMLTHDSLGTPALHRLLEFTAFSWSGS